MKKRALLVGINYTGSDHELHGCINDSNNMNTFLTGRGFTEIRQILEAKATTVGIIDGLNWLIADIEPGDVILFHYSGHGSQLPSAIEADGFEEIICPVDLDWMTKIITDTTLHDILNKVPNGINITVILDCCHSGTMLNQTESLNGTRVTSQSKKNKDGRYLAPPTEVIKKLKNRKLVDWQISRDVNESALLIAGCHANQTSADAFIDGVAQGAATASLLQVVARNPIISYRDLVVAMVDFMVKNRYEQVPELDGSPRLYDSKFTEPFMPPVARLINESPAGEPAAVQPLVPVTSVSQQTKVLIGVGIILLVLFIIFA